MIFNNKEKAIQQLKQYFDAKSRSGSSDIQINAYGSQKYQSDAEMYDFVSSEIRNIIAFSANDALLEVGCGSGAILDNLRPHVGSAIGLDISEGMLYQAKKMKNLQVVLYDGLQMPFEDRSFDKILIYSVLLNISSYTSVVQLIMEALRVLKPCGKILIGNLPHPDKSVFKPYWSPITMLRELKRYFEPFITSETAKRPGYFGYKYSFFTNIFDKCDVKDITIYKSRIPLPGWDVKYHIVYTKQA